MSNLQEWLLWGFFAILFLGFGVLVSYLRKLRDEKIQAKVQQEAEKNISKITEQAKEDVKRREEEIKKDYSSK